MKEVNMGETTPSPTVDVVDEQVVELVTREGGVRKPGGGAAGKIATDLKLAPQTVSASLRRLEEANRIVVTRNTAGNITTVLPVKAAEPVTTEASRESESPSEQSAAEEVDLTAITPQEETVEVDRIASLLEEAKAEIVAAILSHRQGDSCVDAVSSAMVSLIETQRLAANRATDHERERIFGPLSGLSAAEAIEALLSRGDRQ